MLNGIPRTIPSLLNFVLTIISYSDGEGSGGVGVAVFNHPNHSRPQAGYMRLPSVLRDLCRLIEQKLNGVADYEDIYQIEAIGPLLVLESWPDALHSCCWVHWIDNSAAQSSLINGSITIAREFDCGCNLDENNRNKKRRINPWFERVATDSNPVDGLSRGQTPSN